MSAADRRARALAAASELCEWCGAAPVVCAGEQGCDTLIYPCCDSGPNDPDSAFLFVGRLVCHGCLLREAYRAAQKRLGVTP